jgi:hypothetical protein
MSKLSNLSLSDLYGLKNSLVEKRKYDIELLIANGKHEKAIEKGCEDNATNNTLRAINEEIERRETEIINEIVEEPIKKELVDKIMALLTESDIKSMDKSESVLRDMLMNISIKELNGKFNEIDATKNPLNYGIRPLNFPR